MLARVVERATVNLARTKSRRSFIGKVGKGFVAFVGGPFVAVALNPDRAEAHHLCGHLFTTGSCPHPYSPKTRIDKYGYPVHPKFGYPVDDRGDVYTSRSQSRRKVCQAVVPEEYPFTGEPTFGGGWSRCCGGRIRRLQDCCSFSNTRINGDGSVTGYCHHGRKVFCIMYRDTNRKC